MIEGTYVGGMAGVVVLLPSGRRLTAWRDESVELLPNEVEALSGNPEWVLVSPTGDAEPESPDADTSQEDDE